MVAYEFYWRDDKDNLIGILLPERRKTSGRITQESITNLARKVIGDDTEAKDISFFQVEMEEEV